MVQGWADMDRALFGVRTATRFPPDAFWVDLWPWRAGRVARAWYVTARHRLADAWYVLRHGFSEVDD